MLHAARWKYRTQKGRKNRHLRTIGQLRRAMCSQLRHVSTIGKKNLLSSNISSTCSHNMANFGPLVAEIGWQTLHDLWPSPGLVHYIYFFRELLPPDGILPHAKFTLRPSIAISYIGSVTARHSSSGRQTKFAALSRGRHLYSAGRP